MCRIILKHSIAFQLLLGLLLPNVSYGQLSIQVKIDTVSTVNIGTTDSIYFIFTTDFLGKRFDRDNKYEVHAVCPDADGTCHIQLSNFIGNSYLTIAKGKTKSIFKESFAPMLSNYLCMAGDSIGIDLTNIVPIGDSSTMAGWYVYNASFSGIGAEKYRFLFKCAQNYENGVWGVLPSKLKDSIHLSEDQKDKLLSIFRIDKGFKGRLAYLNELHKSGLLNRAEFTILEADIYGDYLVDQYNFLFAFGRLYSNEVNKTLLPFRMRFLEKNYLTMNLSVYKAFSRSFAEGVMFFIKASFPDQDSRSKLLVYESISKLESPFRDKVLTLYLLSQTLHIDSMVNSLFTNSTKLITNERYKALLKNVLNQYSSGMVAHPFSLLSSSGDSISLKQLKGKVVFIDFWYTGCTNCITYYQSTLSKIEEEFQDNHNIVFISISIDKNKLQWEKSINSKKYTSGRALNLYTGGTGADHEVISGYNVTGYPRPILIGKNGQIFTSNNTLLRSEDLLRQQINDALKVQM